MTKSFQVVIRVEPIKTAYALRGADHHQKRLEPLKPSIDRSRSHLNEICFGSGDVQADVLGVVSKYTKAHSKTALAGELILTANAEWFDEISPDWRKGIYTKAFDEWKRLNIEWAQETYPGLAAMYLNMDERAPHFHAYVVPVHTKKIKYRRGEKLATRIKYNDVFGDDMQVIVAARKAKNSELTKCGRMQTDYANAMKSTGLIRGIANAHVDHETIQEYQTRLAQPLEKLVKAPPAPIPTLQDKAAETLGIETTYSIEKVKHTKAVAKVRAKNHETISQAFTKASEYDKMAEKNARLVALLAEKDEQLKAQGAELRTQKDTVTKLRGIPLESIAESILYDGEIRWKNGIDMVKELGGFDYQQAVAWLYNEFGEEAAVGSVVYKSISKARNIISVNPQRPITEAETEVKNALNRQLTALDAKGYRVTLQVADKDATPALQTYNHGKGKGTAGAELFYKATDLTAMIPQLRRENARGYNVYITPFDDQQHYLLVDDLTNESLTRFTAVGYTPNLLQSTSPTKMQGVFVLPKADVEKPAHDALFNELNEKFGDQKITGYVHPFRAAGFTNAKPKYRTEKGLRPIVRILNTAKGACKTALAWARAFMANTDLAAAPRPVKTSVKDSVSDELKRSLPAANPDAAPSVKASLEATEFYKWIAIRYADEIAGIDYSRADWMLCNRMQAKGFTPVDIGLAMWSHSPGIHERHTDVIRYLDDTLSNSASKTIRPS